MANTSTRKDEGAEQGMKHAQQAGADAAGKAKEAARSAGEALTSAADAGASAVGGGMKSLADTVRHNAPSEGMIGTAASTVAKALEQGGRYLQKEGVTGMAEDFTDLIRRNPIPAVLVGIGIGFLLAQLTRS